MYHGENGPTAKATDFGYSSFGLTEEDRVRLPRSWPWYAPERTITPNFSLRDAKKTDVYSFGLVCLYTLFRHHFGGPGEDSESILNEWKTSSFEHKSGIVLKVNELLHRATGVSDTLKNSLREFFQSTLPERPNRRITDFRTLIGYLE